MKNIEEALTILKELKDKQLQEHTKDLLVKLYKEMGYTAVSEEIANNRHAKDNAIYGLKMFIRDKKSKRINPETREIVWSPSKERLQQLDYFEATLTEIINSTLENNTPKQEEYLKLKLAYNNAHYNYSVKLGLHDSFIHTLDRKNDIDWKEKLEKYSQELDELEAIQKNTENKLDNFVMDNLK